LAAEAVPGPDPASGLSALISQWDIDTRTDAPATSADALAGRAAQAWGRGLPMLKGLAMQEISAIYADTLGMASTDLSLPATERRNCNA
jgi:hypothetical protein